MKTIHDKINELISDGVRVESRAIGRVGRIIGVLNGQCTIQRSNGNWGVTSFLVGDRVALQKNGKRWQVVNAPMRFVRMFKPQFAPLVEAGTKLQTVRPMPERMPRPGDLISCRVWTGRPYNSPQRILREATITRVDKISIHFDGAAIIELGGRMLSIYEAEAFAQADGFDSFHAMLAWFQKEHGLGEFKSFEGIAIFWEAAGK